MRIPTLFCSIKIVLLNSREYNCPPVVMQTDLFFLFLKLMKRGNLAEYIYFLLITDVGEIRNYYL